MRRGVIVIVFCMLVARSAQAEGLLSLYQQALSADPSLLSAKFGEDVSVEKRRQALAGFLPTVSAQFQSENTQQRVLSSTNPYYGVGKTIYPTLDWSATITQPLFHVDKWYAYNEADLEKFQSNLNLRVAREALMQNMVKSYLSALKARRNQDLAKAEKATLKSELEVSSVKYASGLIAVSELRDVQARYAEVEARVLSSQTDFQDAIEVLRGMVGRPVTDLMHLRTDAKLPEISPMPVAERVKQALQDNPKVQSKQVAVAIATTEKQRIFAGHFPTADLIGKYERNDAKGSLLGGGSKIDTADLTVQVNVPLYGGGLVQSETREAVYKSEQARVELEAARRSVERDIRTGYASLRSGRERISALVRSCDAKRSLYNLKRQGYMAGVNSMLDQLEAQRDYYIAQRNLAAARFDLLDDYVKFKQAAGTLGIRDIKAINALLADGKDGGSDGGKRQAPIPSPLRIRPNRPGPKVSPHGPRERRPGTMAWVSPLP